MENTHTGTIVENSENIHIEHSAGGDIYISEIGSEDNQQGFAPINVDAYSEEYCVQPVFTSKLLQQLFERRLLLLSGGAGFDKNEFARHLAFLMLKEGTETAIAEWRSAEDYESLFKELRENTTRTLFVIPDCAPQNIGHDLARLAEVASLHQHFVILTTELTAITWQLSEVLLKLYWYEIPGSGIYSVEVLCAYLIRRIEEKRTLFHISAETELQSEALITSRRSPRILSAEFDSPQQINLFITFLEGDDSESTLDEKISRVISNVKDQRESIVAKWYRSLDSTKRLLALGVAMLDGLFDDQFFAVMQHIVNDFWHYRDSRLQSLDYCDLDFLLSYFSFETYDDGRQCLVCKYPGQRAEIIRTAWLSNKRHILSAFTVLTSLAGASSSRAPGRINYPEINGTRERGMRLRAVAAETISDIGMVSLQSAEPKLVELAASSDQTTRRITAKAMARWRAFGQEQQMYDTLVRWKERSANVRSTVVFTLQYAAEYDAPGHLDPRIMFLLNSLSGDPAVSATMKDLLPKLIESHLSVIQEDLRDYFAVEQQYSDLLANSIVQLYATHPYEIKALLEDWLTSCWDQASLSNRRGAFTFRDNRLVLILKVYRSIKYGTGSDAVTIGFVWKLLDRLHVEEQRAGMRAFVLETAAYMIHAHPEEAIRHIEPIFRKLGIEGREVLIHSIGGIYLRQRSMLQNGHYVIRVHNLDIPIWSNSPRPFTEIEEVLYKWLNGSYAFAREVATLSFVEFAVLLDYDEPMLLQNAINAASAHQQEQARKQYEQDFNRRMEAAIVYPTVPILSLWSRIKIFFWLLFRTQEEKNLLKELMNVLLMYRKTNPAYLNILILRWKVHQSERVRRMAWWVGKLLRI